jgi:hypothetical protein
VNEVNVSTNTINEVIIQADTNDISIITYHNDISIIDASNISIQISPIILEASINYESVQATIDNSSLEVNSIDIITGYDENSNQSSTLTYTNNNLTRIDYINGSYKTFTYDIDNKLIASIFHNLNNIITKTFIYDINDNLINVIVS